MSDSVALLCELDGRVREVLRTCPGAPRLALGEPVERLVAASSRGAIRDLLGRVRADGHAIGWLLTVPIGGRDTPFQAAGARVEDHILLLAWPNRPLFSLGDEQALAEGARPPRFHGDLDLYDEMSRLNNDLATMQRELVRRNANLEALIREKNEILGMAAHDLRNPLATIHGIAEHLIGEVRSVIGERQAEMLEHLRTSSEHMLHLVEDLLDLTALQSGTLSLDLRSTDLPDLVGRAVRLAREVARDKGIRIDLEPMDPPAVARAAALDPHKIMQALSNLLSNAIKFSHPGGSISVRVAYAGEAVSIAVVDRGVGIEPFVVERLFKPFHSGRPGTRGERSTGLGLTIVRRILRGHGGDVQVESRVDEGSTFTIHLPLRPMVVAEATAPATTRPRADGLEVLIADDDPATRAVIRALLEALGCRVSEAPDAGEALGALRGRCFDLAIVDVEMPGGGGRAVVEALRAEGRATPPVAALTGHADPARVLAEGPAFDGYLSKPARLDDLAALVGRLFPRLHAESAVMSSPPL